MRELAIKHKDYILHCLKENQCRNGLIRTELFTAYIAETGAKVNKSCPSCVLTEVYPAYKKIIDAL